MTSDQHTILCVDDEENVLNSLKRLLRKEDYKILTACCGIDGLKILEENDIHLVISDHRMPEMSGTDFLAIVKESYPEIIRIVLTGYTEVDSITESVNKGHIYKFIIKPWDDQNLKLEIRQGLEQFRLLQSNKKLHEMIVQQNEELKVMNENLGEMVQERTKELEIKNQALEISRAILENLPMPVIGISSELMIVLTNNEAQALSAGNGKLELGSNIDHYFPMEIKEKITSVLTKNTLEKIGNYTIFGETFDVDLVPLSGKFRGKGLILALKRENY